MSVAERTANFTIRVARNHSGILVRAGVMAATITTAAILAHTPDAQAFFINSNLSTAASKPEPGKNIPTQKGGNENGNRNRNSNENDNNNNSNGNGNGNRNGNGNDNESDDPNSEESNFGNTYRERKRNEKEDTKQERRAKEELEREIREQQDRDTDRRITQCIADLKNDPDFKGEEIVPRKVRVIGEKGVGVEELAAVIKSRGLEPFDDPMHHSIHRIILGALGKPNEEFRNACLLKVLDQEKIEHAEPYLLRESPVDRAIKECTENKRKQYANSQYSPDSLNVLFEDGVSEDMAIAILRGLGYQPQTPQIYPPRRVTIVNVRTGDILMTACEIEQHREIDLVEPNFINRESGRRTIIEAGFRRLAAGRPGLRSVRSLSWAQRIAA